MKKRIVAAVVALVGASVLPMGARAAVDTDESDAIRYGDGDTLGDLVTSLEGRDDEEEVIGIDWTINFFGQPANALCVNTNGTVAPIYLDEAQMAAWGGIGDDDTDIDLSDPDTGTADDFVDCETYDDELTESAEHDEIGYVSPLGADVMYDWEDEGGDCSECQGGAIYIREALIDDHDAVIVTWDEVSMYSTIASEVEGYVNGAGTWSGAEWQVGDWQQLKRNTFQVVFINEETGSESDGFDTTIEFNYGTMGDGSDGYGYLLDADGDIVEYYPDPIGEPDEQDEFDCDDTRSLYSNDFPFDRDFLNLSEFNTLLDDSGLDLSFDTLAEAWAWDRGTLCRWPIGFSSWDPRRERAVGYELFADVAVPELLDGGDDELIGNSRNSDVDGRYVFSMIDGEIDLDPTAGDFCVRCTGAGKHSGGGSSSGVSPETPTEEPSSTPTIGAAGGRALVPGTLQPVSPMLRSDGTLPETSVGRVETLIGSVGSAAPAVGDGSGNWSSGDVARDGYTLTLDLAEGSSPTVDRADPVRVSGQFAPGTLVDVWLFSTPVFVASFVVPANGIFAEEFTLPAGVAAGGHTLQVNGTDASGRAVSINTGLSVTDRTFTLPKTGGGDALGVIALWMLTAGVLLVVTRRRRPA